MDLKRLLITVALVVFTAGAVGGSAYYVMGVQSKKEKEEFEKQIQALEKQVTEVQKGDNEETKTESAKKVETVVAKPNGTPSALVTELVGKYLKNTSGNYNSYYTTNFQNKKSEGISPIVYAQDTPTQFPVSYEYIAADNKEAHVIVYYNYGEESVSTWNVLFILKNENGKWLIDDTKSLRK